MRVAPVSPEFPGCLKADVSIWPTPLWLTDRLWLKGGLGVANATVSGIGDLTGVGWTAAAGVDLVSVETFALDLRLDILGAVFDEGSSARAGFGVGLTWR